MLKHNYEISLMEMDQLANKANLKKSEISLEDMRAQAKEMKTKRVSKVKKKS